jgi:hypothetical protein
MLVHCTNNKLTEGMVVTLQYAGEPISLFKIQQQVDISWEKICRDTYNQYYLSYAKNLATCRGCNKPLPKDQLRIRTEILYHPDRYSNPTPVHVHMCVDPECIQKAQHKYAARVEYECQSQRLTFF